MTGIGSSRILNPSTFIYIGVKVPCLASRSVWCKSYVYSVYGTEVFTVYDVCSVCGTRVFREYDVSSVYHIMVLVI